MDWTLTLGGAVGLAASLPVYRHVSTYSLWPRLALGIPPVGAILGMLSALQLEMLLDYMVNR